MPGITNSMVVSEGGEYAALGEIVAKSMDSTNPIDLNTNDFSSLFDGIGYPPYMFANRILNNVVFADAENTSPIEKPEHTFQSAHIHGTIQSDTLYNHMFSYAQLWNGVPELTTVPSTLPESCFSSTRFHSNVVIPEGVQSLGGSSLSSITYLNVDDFKVVLPSTLTSIPNYTLLCTSAWTLVMKATTPPTLASSWSYGGPASIVVPAGTLSAYQTATNWSAHADIITEATT